MALTQRYEKQKIPPFMTDVGSGSLESANLRDVIYGTDSQTSDKPAFSCPLFVVITTGTGACLLSGEVQPAWNTGGLAALEIPTVFQAPFKSPRPVSEKVTSIKERLGLNVKQLSQVLGVRRPTIYQWLKGGDIRPTNRERVNEMLELSSEWSRLCELPLGSFISEDLDSGESLLELISQEQLSRREIRSAFEVLAPLVEASNAKKKQESLSDRLKAKGYTRPSKAIQDTSIQESFNEITLDD